MNFSSFYQNQLGRIHSKFESVKIYWLSVKFDWFKLLKRGYCKSVKFHWLFQWKLTDLTVKNIFFTGESVKINWFNSEKYFFTDESVKRKITDSISENLTDSDLESKLQLVCRFLSVWNAYYTRTLILEFNL